MEKSIVYKQMPVKIYITVTYFSVSCEIQTHVCVKYKTPFTEYRHFVRVAKKTKFTRLRTTADNCDIIE